MGRPLIDLTGQRFGMLVVDHLYPEDKVYKDGSHPQKQWYCKCDCGGHRIVTGNYLKLGHTTSCGCTNKQEDYVGRTFGKLTVLKKLQKDSGNTRYLCRCECGNEVIVNHYHLRDGKRTHCGKCIRTERPDRVVDLRGDTYGRLTVLEEDPVRHITSGGNIVIKWHCKCSCGRDTYATSSALRNNKIKSCGCLLAENKGMTIEEFENSYANRNNQTGLSLDLTGQRFGKLVAIENLGYIDGKTKWRCKCDCGNETIVQTSNLTNGHTQSCGCINSVGESIIGRYLEKSGIKFIRNYRDERCMDERTLPFDFAIFNNDALVGFIEYDGEQHFHVVRFNGMTHDKAQLAFEEGLVHDQIKNDFCTEYNIPLLRIKYDQRDDIETLINEYLKKLFSHGRIA